MTQKAIARECAEWIRKKATFKSNVTGENMGGFMTVDSPVEQTAYMPINGFTTVDIGCERGNNSYNITLAIQMVPEMFSLISALIKDHKISKNQLKESGIKSLTAGAKGFIVGGLACGIYTACKAGKLGAPFIKVHPGAIGTIVALAFNVIVDSFEYATGQEDELRYRYNITKCAIVSAASLAGGTIAVSVLPIANALAFVIGSIVGSVTASITMSIEERVLLSLCVNSGFTLFGLVKQDYVLPTEVFKGMGLSLAELNQIKPNISKVSAATLNRTIPSVARPSKVDIQILKRGIISFHTIGYVF